RYPPAVRRVLAFSGEPLDVYEGVVPVTMEISAAAGLAPGEYSVPVDVSYQACNNDICLPPAVVRVTVPVRVISP
ncbi:MAG TPA: protein-disulfide reductase DsbD domain-containing protein, partial [Bacteroidota bacterium]|nr:protein-disulfide reductase DsbD domain-containing protein [Bacteroidota bacterium]